MREILLTAIQNTTIGGEKLKNSSRGFRIYFIVIALMIVGMYAFSIFSTKDSDYKYNDFITDLKAGNVSEVTIRQNNEVPSGSIVVVLSKDKSRKVVYVTDVNKVISDIDEIDTDVKPTVTDVAGDNSLMISIIQVLLMAGVVIVIIMVMNGSANAGNAKMANFGKSRARLVLDVKNINFSNVAGLIEEKEELEELNEIVTMYLDYATRQARRHIPMTMEDWKTKLDAFLRFNDADVLQDKGKVTAAIAKEFAESEFEKYRVIQDSLYESDFDKLMNDMEKDGTTH